MSNGGVLGPFPGFTVSQEALQLEGISFDDVKRAFADLKTQRQRVDTMLRENDDLTAEVERLRALEEQWRLGLEAAWAGCATTRAERDRWKDAYARDIKAADSLIVENDRLRAALEPTHDNLWTVAKALSRDGRAENADRDAAHAILAALRARAGLKTTPAQAPVSTPRLSVPERWQCSGCRWVFVQPWQQVCPACHREHYWTASVAPDGAVWPGVVTP